MLLNEDIAERVKEGRRELGMTQGELAKQAGVSRPTIARIEGGRAEHVSLGTVERVLNATNWDLAIDRGVRPKGQDDGFDIEAYLDSLYGNAR
ncbi:helix-turn-helix transcriptional regulator [Adlercreutzia mucosicola]|uniref:Helix-turn-helix domain-containing protein n=1 Tax=Adlercreutzia mucosicola TaxID=580026 RepID=A0A6N8JTK0_9ACTN|nr:helix-turn-helix transcriptional regulator [Adlercreutzia mucosicola]MCR2036297.1 helix-turn-helix transcriptional regulator [Adlercreutzia mucosicola]MEB1814978.1 helix-turn-helix transcriptional regulator [Adlercreutzia mucosicola]MVX62046.1 helix-turn-helix domain-containing protein [Adlercreutzia mucosicola]